MAYGPDITFGKTYDASIIPFSGSLDRAFDDDVDTICWFFEGPTTAMWLEVDLGSGNEADVQQLRIYSREAYNLYAAYDVTFKASNTGAFTGEEVTLLTTGTISWTGGWNEWNFGNGTDYRYYRIYVGSMPQYYLFFEEVEMREAGIVTSSSTTTSTTSSTSSTASTLSTTSSTSSTASTLSTTFTTTTSSSSSTTTTTAPPISFCVFRQVTIPYKALVTKANLFLTSFDTQIESPLLTRIYFSLEDDADPPSGKIDIDSRPFGDPIQWVIYDTWKDNKTYRSPDLSSIIQGVVDRSGWTSGNKLLVKVECESSANRKWSAIEYRAGLEKMKLVVHWRTPRKIQTPRFSPEEGFQLSAFNCEITTYPTDATIYYTVDGSNPDQNDSLYTSPVQVNTLQTIKAIAYKDRWTESDIGIKDYAINLLTTKVLGIVYKEPGGQLYFLYGRVGEPNTWRDKVIDDSGLSAGLTATPDNNFYAVYMKYNSPNEPEIWFNDMKSPQRIFVATQISIIPYNFVLRHDQDNYFHFNYRELGLWYATNKTGTWVRQKVANDCRRNDIRINGDNVPCMAWMAVIDSAFRIYYSVQTVGGGWNTQEVDVLADEGQVFYGEVTLDFEPDGLTPHIFASYGWSSTQGTPCWVRHYYLSGGFWTYETIATGETGVSLFEPGSFIFGGGGQTDSKGDHHVLTHQYSRLNYYRSSTNWTEEIVDDWNIENYNGLIISPDDILYALRFIANTTGDISYYQGIGGVWSKTKVGDTGSNNIHYGRMALGYEGNYAGLTCDIAPPTDPFTGFKDILQSDVGYANDIMGIWIDSTGLIHIVDRRYFGFDYNTGLYHYYGTYGSWSTPELIYIRSEDHASRPWGTGIIDNNDDFHMHLGSYDYWQGVFHNYHTAYRKWTKGVGWGTTVWKSGGNTMLATGIALDYSGATPIPLCYGRAYGTTKAFYWKLDQSETNIDGGTNNCYTTGIVRLDNGQLYGATFYGDHINITIESGGSYEHDSTIISHGTNINASYPNQTFWTDGSYLYLKSTEVDTANGFPYYYNLTIWHNKSGVISGGWDREVVSCLQSSNNPSYVAQGFSVSPNGVVGVIALANLGFGTVPRWRIEIATGQIESLTKKVLDWDIDLYRTGLNVAMNPVDDKMHSVWVDYKDNEYNHQYLKET